MPARATHKYPRGKPVPLRLLDIALLAAGLLWVVLAARSWLVAIGIAALFVCLAFLQARLIKSYERAGLAIPIERPKVSLGFTGRLLPPLRVLRYVYFILVGILVFFGLAPVSQQVARAGVISAVISLFVAAGAYIVLSWYYSGRNDSRELHPDTKRE
jgi:hypothetical protein